MNCGTILPDLLEGELFDHEKGASTGAYTPRIGPFEAANDLSEAIGDTSLSCRPGCCLY